MLWLWQRGPVSGRSAFAGEASPKLWLVAAPAMTSSFSANLGMMARRSANLHVSPFVPLHGDLVVRGHESRLQLEPLS